METLAAPKAAPSKFVPQYEIYWMGYLGMEGRARPIYLDSSSNFCVRMAV